ncbi:cysteine--tRNA ligase [Buchnera aphidicola]|uniref:cysteine--tRNA ligase n=1 Tax=Buchnera aphidicola TaxID=9 RepID=UPI0031B8B224
MLKIFNSLTKKKENFKPVFLNHVNMYVCGVTVYDLCHIGHGRTFIIFDLIARYLRYCGYTVTYVRNITDIDDKIINVSYKKHKCMNFFVNSMINEMHKDFTELNILPPDKEPRVTNYIPVIIQMITELLNSNHAYISKEGNVFFSVDSDINYGVLSGQFLKYLRSGKRICNKGIIKKNKLDFVLWKVSKKNEPYWCSPWGKGRPGWHIECSAMSRYLLGKTLDIHGGGSDLLFPHHENEISQSTCVNKSIYANYWIHSGMVIIKNKKMSKSLGNVFFLRDILNKYDSEIIRYYLLSTHYRQPLLYSEEVLKQSSISLIRLYRALYSTNYKDTLFRHSIFELEFRNAMNDDFNVPLVFSILSNLAKKINVLKIQKDSIEVNKLASVLYFLGNQLGLLYKNPHDFFKKQTKFQKIDITTIEKMLYIRNNARKLKNWTQADNIRKYLFSLDIILEDNQNDTFWYSIKK